MFEQIIVAETHDGKTVLVLGPERRTAIRATVRRLKSNRANPDFSVVYVGTVVRKLKFKKSEPDRIPSAPVPAKEPPKSEAKPKGNGRKKGKGKQSQQTGLTGIAARLLGT